MAPLKNNVLGKLGVNVDKSPLHLDPGELTKAQNAVRDRLGVDGGLKNRPGLLKLNSSAGAGSVLGGIAMPIAGLIDNATLYLAQRDGANEYWYTSSDLFATSAQTTSVAQWQEPNDIVSIAPNVSRMGAFFNGQLYYAAGGYTVGSTSPPIRVFNGTDDRELCRLLPTTTLGIVSMVADRGYLYVLTLDSGTTDADWSGRVFRLAANGHLTQIGPALATGHIPMCLAVHNGLVFVGTGRTTTTNEARIYRINPIDETSWTLDDTLPADDYLVTSLKSFRGLLFATTKNGGAGTSGKIRSRSVTGTWSTVDSTVNNTGTYESLEVFGAYLYASSRSYDAGANTAVIRRSNDGTTWATVYNSASTTGVGLLTAIGSRLFSMFGTGILHTSSGTSYTSATPAGSGNVDGVLGLPLLRRGDAQWEQPVADTGAGTTINVTNVDQRTTAGTLVVKSTDESVTGSSSLQDDDELLFAAAANKTYLIEGYILLAGAPGSSTSDWQFAFDIPAGATLYWGPRWRGSNAYWDLVAVASGASALFTGDTPANVISFGGLPATSIQGFAFTAILIMGGTAGNVVLQWAQNTADAQVNTVKAGSLLRYQTT